MYPNPETLKDSNTSAFIRDASTRGEIDALAAPAYTGHMVNVPEDQYTPLQTAPLGWKACRSWRGAVRLIGPGEERAAFESSQEAVFFIRSNSQTQSSLEA